MKYVPNNNVFYWSTPNDLLNLVAYKYDENDLIRFNLNTGQHYDGKNYENSCFKDYSKFNARRRIVYKLRYY